jgi:DNA-binding MarR family transcriptional regulator
MPDIERLGRAVKQLQNRHHRAMETRLAQVGTTLAQWDALRAIDRMPGSSARDLAAATFQQEQSFGTLASRLEAKGLIERSPGRGRRIEHRLTSDGEEVLAAGRPVTLEVLRDSFASLSSSQQDQLLTMLLSCLDDEPTSDG